MNTTEQHVIRHRDSPAPGRKARGNQAIAEFSGLRVLSLELDAGESFSEETDTETAWLLMSGKVKGRVGERKFALERRSLFDESASCVHASANTSVVFEAMAPCELTVYQCPNRKPFSPRVFTPEDVPNEHRGKGQVAERCLRFVRTIFDGSNSPDAAEMVLGEVVTLPGGWSSYPPHHHRQPEIYHYRFTAPQGYGHAELGAQVFKVNERDTVCIPPGLDHAQCAAPGYGMYYSWVIRHLPNDPYTVPDFTAEHAWTMDKDAGYWWPADVQKK
ncbi:MAG TPA: 5-deoxy-glucuronate isomerase [Woeseiaceae bacterium]|nr:5-deoxy-glucuronate isomerase [Woeseiaceae bacterium]